VKADRLPVAITYGSTRSTWRFRL